MSALPFKGIPKIADQNTFSLVFRLNALTFAKALFCNKYAACGSVPVIILRFFFFKFKEGEEKINL